jgi:Skp family chaperone for outer membrane proteins
VFIFSVFVLISGTMTLCAQPPAAAPTFKIAVFDSEMLTDEKAGIKKLVAAYKSISTEFKPRMDEIAGLKAKYETLTKQIQETQNTADPKVIRAKYDEAEILKRDIERKQQDGQQALDKRVKEMTGPIYQDIGNALQAFAKARGFDLIFDLAKFNEAIMVVNPGTDIAAAFISDYNAKNSVVPTGVPVK